MTPIRLVAFLAAISLAPSAFAQGRDPRAATEFFSRGRDASKKSDFAAACPLFAESHRLDPKVGTLLNLADCEEHIGQLASARQHWQQAADLAQSLADERATLAKERFVAVDKRVPKLILRAPARAPAGMTVKRDGIEFSAVGFGIPLPADPGDHTIAISAPGYVARTVRVELKEGEQREVQLDLVAATAAPDAPTPAVTAPVTAPVPATVAPTPNAPPKPQTDETASARSSRKTLAYAVGGLGIIGVGVGTVFGLQAISKNSDSNADGHCTGGCDSIGKDARNAALAAARLSTVAFIVGGAALTTAVVIFVTAPADSNAPKNVARVEAGAQAAPGGASFVLRGTW